jgi:hypothetical protein
MARAPSNSYQFKLKLCSQSINSRYEQSILKNVHEQGPSLGTVRKTMQRINIGKIQFTVMYIWIMERHCHCHPNVFSVIIVSHGSLFSHLYAAMLCRKRYKGKTVALCHATSLINHIPTFPISLICLYIVYRLTKLSR